MTEISRREAMQRLMAAVAAGMVVPSIVGAAEWKPISAELGGFIDAAAVGVVAHGRRAGLEVLRDGVAASVGEALADERRAEGPPLRRGPGRRRAAQSAHFT